MKSKILALLLVFLSISLKAQHTYVPMAIESARWLILWDDFDTPQPDEYYGYKIEGDTLINNIQYKKIYSRGFAAVNGNFAPPYIITGESIYGAIRDDIPNKKVYGIQFWANYPYNICPVNEEFLMYDFNMDIGDNYEDQCLTDFLTNLILDNIDIINIYGHDRLIQTSDGWEWCFQIIEGVGSSSGLFEDTTAGCWFKNNLFPWTPSLSDYCVGTDELCYEWFLLDNIDHITNEKITLFPNPVHTTFSIDSNFIFQKLSLFNLRGQKVAVFGKKDSYSVSGFQPGIYFVKIETVTNIYTKKIIVQ